MRQFANDTHSNRKKLLLSDLSIMLIIKGLSEKSICLSVDDFISKINSFSLQIINSSLRNFIWERLISWI
jgi:hypothetical protein